MRKRACTAERGKLAPRRLHSVTLCNFGGSQLATHALVVSVTIGFPKRHGYVQGLRARTRMRIKKEDEGGTPPFHPKTLQVMQFKFQWGGSLCGAAMQWVLPPGYSALNEVQ